ncbi:hypothetical protein [Burkholderia contaminans]|uniref:hypothetical protein n=1 Tax=Burkholderia contaminans TaxID=488447 RepID=UPI001CF538D0|nr:hypothetical protein [Burkholderia contaminans]MCA8098519.1 hypothetical protein [Burkholderia contaminans]
MGYIKYGDSIRLANGYAFQSRTDQLWTSGYLGVGDTMSGLNNASKRVGAYAGYSDNDLQTQWKITSVATTGDGSSIFSGDQVRLQSPVGDEGYLALFDFNSPSNSGYPVATTTYKSDATIDSVWTIFIYSGATANDARLSDKAYVYLVSTFPKKDSRGEVVGTLAAALDTNGVGSAYSFQYLVTGGRLINRDGGSGSWQVTSVT